MNLAFTMAPISLVMIFWQINPFLISIISYFMLSEPVIPVEIIGMCICFGAVVLITTQQKHENHDGDIVVEEDKFDQ